MLLITKIITMIKEYSAGILIFKKLSNLTQYLFLITRKNGFERGCDYARKNEDNFRVPCSKCGKLMYFSSKDVDWNNEKNSLYQAFLEWSHVSCN